MDTSLFEGVEGAETLIRPVFLSILSQRQCPFNKILSDSHSFLDSNHFDEIISSDHDLLSKVSTRFNEIVNNIEKNAKRCDINKNEDKISLENVLKTHLENGYTIPNCLDDSHQQILNRILNETNAFDKSISLKTKRKLSKQKRSNARRQLKYQQHLSGPDSEDVKLLKKYPDDYWPKSDSGFFCLLRGFLTKGGERKLLSTAQMCEYVREWQIYKGQKLGKSGLNYNWINRVEDWSSITLQALNFLSAESAISNSELSPSGNPVGVRHSSRRLQCPRPFVNPRPRTHQWSWLLNPPRASPPNADSDSNKKFKSEFDTETDELCSLFSDWLRAPRGLGGLTDAVLSVSAKVTFSKLNNLSQKTSHSRRKLSSAQSPRKRPLLQHSISDDDDGGDVDVDDNCCKANDPDGNVNVGDDFVDDDYDSELSGQGRLKIVDYHHSHQGTGTDEENDFEIKHKRYLHSDNNLGSVVDGNVPLPYFPTTWKLRPFTKEEKLNFQTQEAIRFEKPWLPFVYHIQNYRAVVGPLRSAPSAVDKLSHVHFNSYKTMQSSCKAREHPLLKLNRPIFVNLAEIVRDAVACLPNGEGTRADIATLVQNSGFLLPNVNPRQLQQCISSALDRLQSETNDPSVYFNASLRFWIYRHRFRKVEEFAELHEARCAMNETKKAIQRGVSSGCGNYSFSMGHSTSKSRQSSSYSSKHSKGLPNPRRPTTKFISHPRRVSREYGYNPAQYGYNDDDDDDDCNEDFVNVYDDYIKGGKHEDDDDDDDHIPDIEELEAANHFDTFEQYTMDFDHPVMMGSSNIHYDNVNDNSDDDGNFEQQQVLNYDPILKSNLFNSFNCRKTPMTMDNVKRNRALVTSRKHRSQSNRPSILSHRGHSDHNYQYR